MMMLKRLVKSWLKRLDIIAFKRSSRVYIPEEESYRIVADLVGRPDPVVVDGGAHLGDMVEKFGALLPQAEFHCFEPDPELGQILTCKYAGNKKIHVILAALGDKPGKAKLNINASRPTNSLLSSPNFLEPDLKQLCELVEQVEVDVKTIDEYCRANSIGRVDVIKLDLQGYDFLALKGAMASLDKATVVLVEVLFKEIYQGCHCFHDVLGLMREAGFGIYTLCGIQYGNASELLWADAIFVKHDRM